MKKNAAAFAAGAAGYPCIELAARGYTHWSMALLGGLCAVMLRQLVCRTPGWGLVRQAAAGAAMITAAEFAAGLLVNRVLGWQVWDYSARFGDVLGQICPLYSFYWFLLCLPVLAVLRGCMRAERRKG